MSADREIVSTRVFDAPRSKVFRAWTEAEHLSRWWGPKGFTNTFHEHDPRPGGAWRFVMHGPDGKDYRNESVYAEVVPGERIVFDHLNGPRYHATITFADDGGKTRITWSMVFGSDSEYRAVKERAGIGNEENLDRLEAELARMA